MANEQDKVVIPGLLRPWPKELMDWPSQEVEQQALKDAWPNGDAVLKASQTARIAPLMPPLKWRATIVKPHAGWGWVRYDVHTAPSWFHRLMHRLLLGIKWERL